jgi:molybdopterin synthase catalytic subunit
MNGGDDLIRLQAEPIDVGAVVNWVADGDAGGITAFVGATRREMGDGGKALAALDYEAYEEMAVGQMRKLAARARQQWPIRKLAIVHRKGRVEVAAPSVVIAVSTPHRDQAFAACRFLIDALKAELAVWKKEIWTDGSASWMD